jgi:hypothetical protein
LERSPIRLMNEMRRGRWWEDLRMAAVAVGVGAVTPSWDGTNLGWIFPDVVGNNPQMQFITQMPHNYALGEDVEIHIHWALVDTDGAANEDVKWDVQYRVTQTGGIIGAFPAMTENTIDVSSYLQHELLYHDLADIDMSGVTETSAIVEIILERDTAGVTADDYKHDVLLKELDIHYPIDSLGSWAELSKWGG